MAIATPAAVFVIVIGVEVMLAYRREFLPTSPAAVIGGTFGPADGRPLRFVVLGDSTAAGLGAGDPSLAYPALLGEMLGADGYRVEMTGLGVSGARVADVLHEQVPLALEKDPDLIFVGIGANDTTHLTSLGAVERDMTEVYEELVASGAVVVGSGVPDMRAAAFYEPLRSIVGWRGRRVTGAIEKAAERLGVPIVPLARETGPFFASNPDAAYSDDLFHPGPGGYAAWADAIYPYLAAALDR